MTSENRKSQERDHTEKLMTQEEKEALLDQKIKLMKLKNEERMKKFQEIEEDKKWAEREGRSVSLKGSHHSDEDDEWPIRVDRYEEVAQNDRRHVSDVRRGQQRKVDARAKFPEGDGPPPDPVYNFLADQSRYDDAYYEDPPREDTGSRNRQRGGGHPLDRQQQNYGSRSGHFGRSKQFHGPGRNERFGATNTAQYDNWRKERDKIDNARIERQKTKDGGWRREWDREKLDDDEEPNQYKETVNNLVEGPIRKIIEVETSTPSNSDASYSKVRGRGRGRGRLRSNVGTNSPRMESTPERDLSAGQWSGNKGPPRFRQRPEDISESSHKVPAAVKLPSDSRGTPNTSHQAMLHAQKQTDVSWPSNETQPGSYPRSRIDPKTGLRDSPGPKGTSQDIQPGSYPVDRPDLKLKNDLRGDHPRQKDGVENVDYINTRGSLIVTIGNQEQVGKNDSVTRVVRNQPSGEQDYLPETMDETELLSHGKITRSPKKGKLVGSGRLAPPPKGRNIGHGKGGKTAATKNKRSGSGWARNEEDGEGVTTIGIAVITTPGDTIKNSSRDKGQIVQQGSIQAVTEGQRAVASNSKENVEHLVGSDAKHIKIGSIMIDDVMVDDDDDDEWEDIEEGCDDYEDAEDDEGEHNGSFERFIEEHTLKLDINTAMAVAEQQRTLPYPPISPYTPGSQESFLKTPTDPVDWAAEMDALSQERHRTKSVDFQSPNIQPNDPGLDTSFQSISALESSSEQGEFCLSPFTSGVTVDQEDEVTTGHSEVNERACSVVDRQSTCSDAPVTEITDQTFSGVESQAAHSDTAGSESLSTYATDLAPNVQTVANIVTAAGDKQTASVPVADSKSGNLSQPSSEKELQCTVADELPSDRNTECEHYTIQTTELLDIDNSSASQLEPSSGTLELPSEEQLLMSSSSEVDASMPDDVADQSSGAALSDFTDSGLISQSKVQLESAEEMIKENIKQDITAEAGALPTTAGEHSGLSLVEANILCPSEPFGTIHAVDGQTEIYNGNTSETNVTDDSLTKDQQIINSDEASKISLNVDHKGEESLKSLVLSTAVNNEEVTQAKIETKSEEDSSADCNKEKNSEDVFN